MLEAEKEWKHFLKDSSYPTNHNRFYLFLTDSVKVNNTGLKGVDYYMSRTLDATIVTTSDSSFVAVYGKFLRFVFWGILKGGDEHKISELKINPIGGEIGAPQKFEEEIMTGFFINRIRQIETLPGTSDKQQEVIEKELLKDKELFLKTDAARAIINDFNLNKDE